MIKNYLLAPGPTPVPPRVALAMAPPIIHHRTPQFSRIFAEAQHGLKRLFQTEQDVLMLAASGTGAMESAITNLFSPGDEVLAINGGKFGERWGDDDAVVGLVVRQNQQELNVRVRQGVILCAGGFVMNEEMIRKYAPMLRGALDDSDRAIIRGKMNDEWRDQLEKQLIGSDGKVLRPELVSDDGLKWMGMNVVPKSVAAELGESTVNALRGIPGAGIAIDRGVQFGQATKKALNGLFSPFGPLANAPAVFRDKMIELGRNFTAARTFHSGRLLREV